MVLMLVHNLVNVMIVKIPMGKSEHIMVIAGNYPHQIVNMVIRKIMVVENLNALLVEINAICLEEDQI